MIDKKSLKSPKKKINSRRKSRELIMKGVYRALVNNFDIKQIKKDIQDDPDFIRADEAFFLEVVDGIFDNFDLLKKEIITYLDKNYDELSPIELAIIYCSLFELKFSPSVPYRVVINEAIEIAKSFGGTDGHKFINGVLNKAAAINRKHEFATKTN